MLHSWVHLEGNAASGSCSNEFVSFEMPTVPTLGGLCSDPFTHTSISAGQAVALHKHFLGYSGQQMKLPWGEILHSASAAAAAIASAMTHLGTCDQEAQDSPFNCFALQHCQTSSPGTGQQLQVILTWTECVTPQERMQLPPKNSSRVLCFHFQHKLA